MMRTTGMLSMTSFLFFSAIGMPSATRAQHHGHHETMTQHQQMMTADHMHQMHVMTQHMAQMMERSRHLSQTLGQMMEGHQGPMRDRMGMMQQMCGSMAAVAEHMKTNMERCTQLMQDGTIADDQAAQKEMEELRRCLEDMSQPLDGAVKSLEKMTRQLEKTGSGD